MMVLQKDILF